MTEFHSEISRIATIEARRWNQQVEDDVAAFLVVTGLDPSDCVIEWGPCDLATFRHPYRIYSKVAPKPIAQA